LSIRKVAAESSSRKAKALFIPVAEILEPLESLEAEIAADLKEPRGML